jgi:glutamate/aspartate transport system permease protein
MRSIPLVMVILWFFLLMPLHHRPPHWRRVVGHHHLHAFEAAYFSEIMRAGIQSCRAARCMPARRWA